MRNKKIMFIFVLICITIFLIFYYIFCILGNNININQDEIVEDILNNANYYEANIDVIVKSNKTENKYNMFQEVNKESSKLVVNAPENIKDMSIELSNNTLRITNAKTNMEKIYNDYETIMNNSLFLNTFVEDYKNNESKILENDEYIILQVKLNNSSNTYINFKELHIDKLNKIPRELIIKDNTQKTTISIIYNDIKIK